jgi:hypothetical protein
LFGAFDCPRDALDREPRDIDRWGSMQVEVADRLTDRGPLKEAVPGEPGRIEEPEAVGLRLSDRRVVIRGDLVERTS